MAKNDILISDAHIKSRLWTNNSAIIDDSYRALDMIISKIPKSDIKPNLLSCGDLFDSTRPTAKDVDSVVSFCANFKKVFYVDGNHDKVNPSWLESISPNAVHLNSHDPVSYNKSLLFGIDYCADKVELFEHLLEIAECDPGASKIILMHQAVKEFLGFEGSYACSADELFDVLNKNCTVYCGDIHKYLTVEDPKRKLKIVSPGPVIPQDIGQVMNGSGYYYTSNGTDFIQHSLSVRNFVIVKSLNELNKALKHKAVLYADLPEIIYCLFPQGTVLPSLTTTQKENRIFIVKNTVTETPQSVKAQERSAVYSIADAVAEDLKNTSSKPDKMIAFANAVLTSDDPSLYLTELLDKWKVIKC